MTNQEFSIAASNKSRISVDSDFLSDAFNKALHIGHHADSTNSIGGDQLSRLQILIRSVIETASLKE